MSAPSTSVSRDPKGPRSGLRLAVLAGLGAGAVSQGITTVASLVALPLALSGLGVQRFAWYVALLAAPTMLGSPDLGIGSGLVSPLSGAVAAGDATRARGLVAATGRMLVVAGTVGGSLVILGGLAYARGTKSSLSESHELATAVACLAACTCVVVPVSIGARILLAYQRSWAVSVANAGVAILGVLSLAACSVFRVSLPYYILAYFLPWIFSGSLLTLIAFRSLPRTHSEMRWITYVRVVLVSGSKYSLLQFCGALLYQADGLIILHYLGETSATTLNVATRLFGLGPLVSSLLLTPLWPALAAKKVDPTFVGRRLYGLTILVCLTINGSWAAACLFLGQDAVAFWTHGTVADIPPELAIVLSAWLLVNAVNGPTATFLNAWEDLRRQLISAIPMVPCNLIISVTFADHGLIYGPAVGSVITQLFIGLPLQVGGLMRNLSTEVMRSEP